MAPPKKDAFADLFQSANSGSNSSLNDKNLSLLERQRRQQSPAMNKPNHSQSSWSNLDILNGSTASNSSVGSANQSRSATPYQSNDPFSIFDKPQTRQTPEPKKESKPVPQVHTETVGGGRALNKGHEISLLDDEFTDAFTPEPEPKPTEQPKQYTASAYNTDDEFSARSSPISQMSETSNRSGRGDNKKSGEGHTNTGRGSSTDARDTTLAELIDIGFSIEQSNQAIDEVGLDLQTCVNFIMGGGKKKEQSRRPVNDNRDAHNDFGAKMNDLSSDFFNKASLFINNSRNTVIKNIGQFQKQHARQGQRDEQDSLPAWMKSQHMYKEDATERKANGGVSADYGSDEENIDQNAINDFMSSQRMKDKERQRARYEHFKGLAKSKLNGSSSTLDSQLGRTSPMKHPDLPQRPSLQPQSVLSVSRSEPKRNIQKTSEQPEKLQQKPQQKPQPVKPHPSQPAESEVDLLGMNGKPGAVTSQGMLSRGGRSVEHAFVLTPLNQFQVSDYETSKDKATELFKVGDYDTAQASYVRCLESLPEKHELRLVINSNLALTLIKAGNYKQAKTCCDEALKLVSEDDLLDSTYLINEKTIKSWYIKLLCRKAESLEMLEAFPQALETYMALVSKYGVTDKKVMDGKRRVNNIVNPPKQKPKAATPPAPAKPKTSAPASNENLRRVQKHHEDTKKHEEMKFSLHDSIQEKVFAWSNGKEDNIRTLLMSLSDIIPDRLGLPFTTTNKLTINDLMLPKKVKINYMKVISAIHPDKMTNMEMEDKMICEAVFITLNKSWDIFKEQNGMS